MKIVIVSGSTRAGSRSRRIADRINEKLAKLGASPYIIDLYENNLPMYDDTKHEEWESVLSQLEGADGYVLVTPEWNGSAGPGLINFLTYASESKPKPLAHKPVLLVSVSSGAGGSYPIAELKAFHNKNNLPVFIPDHLRFRDAKHIFNTSEPEPGNEVDQQMHERMEYALKILVAYSDKLKDIRDMGIIDLEKYPNGN
jgi:NAD(P)H-dependent FMN reductase